MLHARLLLEARGIARTPEALAGAMLEAETQMSIIRAVEVWFQQKKAEAREARLGGKGRIRGRG